MTTKVLFLMSKFPMYCRGGKDIMELLTSLLFFSKLVYVRCYTNISKHVFCHCQGNLETARLAV